MPRDRVVASGMPRDGLDALVDPAVWTLAQADDGRGSTGSSSSRATGSSGVRLSGQTRAYPLRFLVWHEVVNDTLAGVPIAVTYNPLCDSAVVFRRTLGARVARFRGERPALRIQPPDVRPSTRGWNAEPLESAPLPSAIAGPPRRPAQPSRCFQSAAPGGDWRRDNPAPPCSPPTGDISESTPATRTPATSVPTPALPRAAAPLARTLPAQNTSGGVGRSAGMDGVSLSRCWQRPTTCRLKRRGPASARPSPICLKGELWPLRSIGCRRVPAWSMPRTSPGTPPTRTTQSGPSARPRRCSGHDAALPGRLQEGEEQEQDGGQEVPVDRVLLDAGALRGRAAAAERPTVTTASRGRRLNRRRRAGHCAPTVAAVRADHS